jgi:hypothetical protein
VDGNGRSDGLRLPAGNLNVPYVKGEGMRKPVDSASVDETLEMVQFVESLGNRANIKLVKSSMDMAHSLVWQGKLGDVELTPEQAMKAGELYGLLNKRASEMAANLIEVK